MKQKYLKLNIHVALECWLSQTFGLHGPVITSPLFLFNCCPFNSTAKHFKNLKQRPDWNVQNICTFYPVALSKPLQNKNFKNNEMHTN